MGPTLQRRVGSIATIDVSREWACPKCVGSFLTLAIPFRTFQEISIHFLKHKKCCGVEYLRVSNWLVLAGSYFRFIFFASNFDAIFKSLEVSWNARHIEQKRKQIASIWNYLTTLFLQQPANTTSGTQQLPRQIIKPGRKTKSVLKVTA